MGVYIETEELTGIEEVDICPDCDRTVIYPGIPPAIRPICPDCGARMEDFGTDELEGLSGLGRTKSQRRRRRRRKRAIALMQAQRAAGKLTEAQYQARSAQIAGKRRAKKKSRKKKYKKIVTGVAMVATAVIAGPAIIKGVTAAGKGLFSAGKAIYGVAGQLLTQAPKPLEEPMDDFEEGFDPFYPQPQLSTEVTEWAPPDPTMQTVTAASRVGPVRPLRFTQDGLARSRLFGGSV